jgi:hypothetical protein
MKATYVTESGRLTFDCEAETAKDLFAQLGSIQEIFEAELKCGACGSVEIRYSYRVVDEYQYYELACRSCQAQFKFGQKKKGGDLFPKRKDEDGHALQNGGWTKWQPEGQQPQGRTPEPAPISQPRTAPRPALHANAGTPDGLQPSFDRLAELFQWRTAPTQLGSALDQLRGEFGMKAGQMGTDRFDKIYRAYEASTGKGTTASAKALMKDCVTALDELPARAIA